MTGENTESINFMDLLKRRLVGSLFIKFENSPERFNYIIKDVILGIGCIVLVFDDASPLAVFPEDKIVLPNEED